MNGTQAFDESPAIYGTQLIQGYLALHFLKTAVYACWIWTPNAGHGSDHDGSQVTIHLIR